MVAGNDGSDRFKNGVKVAEKAAPSCFMKPVRTESTVS